jgi:hypothetical protein
VTQTANRTWASYRAMARMAAVIMRVAVAGTACAATQLRRGFRRPQSARTATEIMALAWLLRRTPQERWPACLGSRQ